MMDGMHAYYWAASGGQDPAGPALLISCARVHVCSQRAVLFD